MRTAPCLPLPPLMQAPVSHIIKGEEFWLSAQRTIFWEAQKALIVSDLHLGKTGHFRKEGIAVPQTVLKEDMQRLMQQIQLYQPSQLIVVGDLFHSHANLEVNFFKRWRHDLPHLSVTLVRGNHDILKKNLYEELDIKVVEEKYCIDKFCFSHEHCEDTTTDYLFCGHIHPGIVVNGLGKQSLRFPCFYFGQSHAILPAFGKFTGLATIKPYEEDVIYAIVENSLIRLK